MRQMLKIWMSMRRWGYIQNKNYENMHHHICSICSVCNQKASSVFKKLMKKLITIWRKTFCKVFPGIIELVMQIFQKMKQTFSPYSFFDNIKSFLAFSSTYWGGLELCKTSKFKANLFGSFGSTIKTSNCLLQCGFC